MARCSIWAKRFTANASSRFGSGNYIWFRPANFAWTDPGSQGKREPGSTPESATVDGTTLVLTHSEDLTRARYPTTTYTVKVDGEAGTNPSAVSVGTRTVTLGPWLRQSS